MLFTSAAVKQFSDATVLMQCIDDLETLYSNKIHLWDGLKDSAMYNQDWLFCWCLQVHTSHTPLPPSLHLRTHSSACVCLQVRMGGKVHLESAFEDIEFPQRKCLTVTEGARQQVGIHHTNPKRMRALWRAYERWALKEGGGGRMPAQTRAMISSSSSSGGGGGGGGGGNRSSRAFSAVEDAAALHSPHDPSRIQECRKGPLRALSHTHNYPHPHCAHIHSLSLLTERAHRACVRACVRAYVRACVLLALQAWTLISVGHTHTYLGGGGAVSSAYHAPHHQHQHQQHQHQQQQQQRTANATPPRFRQTPLPPRRRRYTRATRSAPHTSDTLYSTRAHTVPTSQCALSTQCHWPLCTLCATGTAPEHLSVLWSVWARGV